MTETLPDPFGAPGESLAAPVDHEDHLDGAAVAGVTLVMYGDYECQYTRGTHDVIRTLLRREDLAFRYVFRHFPRVGFHPHAVSAARADGAPLPPDHGGPACWWPSATTPPACAPSASGPRDEYRSCNSRAHTETRRHREKRSSVSLCLRVSPAV